MKKLYICCALFVVVQGNSFSGKASLCASEDLLRNFSAFSKYDSTQIVAAITPRQNGNGYQQAKARPSTRQESQPQGNMYAETLKTIVGLSMRLKEAESNYKTALEQISIMQSEIERLQIVEENYLAAAASINVMKEDLEDLRKRDINFSVAFQGFETLHQEVERLQDIENEYILACQVIETLTTQLNEIESFVTTLKKEFQLVPIPDESYSENLKNRNGMQIDFKPDLVP